MKIGIDISQIVYGTGVSVYTKELVRGLLKVDTENEYVLFGGSLRNQFLLRQFTLSLRGNFKVKVVPISPTAADFIWNRIHRLKIERLIGKIDVFHSSDWTFPPTRAFKVTTVHDLAPLVYPRLTHPKIVAVHKRRLYWVVKEADRIIVPSKVVEEDLIKIGGIKEKIRIIPEAVGQEFKISDSGVINSIRKKYNLNSDYLITVGVGERKNTKKLIEAFQKIKRKNLKLVIVGMGSGKYRERGVIPLGYVPDADLPILYSGSRGLVYPSIYEGFGLPVLQAFACGIPVATSMATAMEEVAGEAAVLVDANSVTSISEGINEILVRPSMWRKKGLKRIKDFSWEKTARETLEVYESGFPKQ